MMDDFERPGAEKWTQLNKQLIRKEFEVIKLQSEAGAVWRAARLDGFQSLR